MATGFSGGRYVRAHDGDKHFRKPASVSSDLPLVLGEMLTELRHRGHCGKIPCFVDGMAQFGPVIDVD